MTHLLRLISTESPSFHPSKMLCIACGVRFRPLVADFAWSRCLMKNAGVEFLTTTHHAVESERSPGIENSRADDSADDEDPMNISQFNNSAVGAGSGSISRWSAPGYRFACGCPTDVWDVAIESRQGGISVLGNKVNGFLKWTAPAPVAEGPHAGGEGVGQMGYATQLCRGVTESGDRLPETVSKGAVSDSSVAVLEEAATKIRGLAAVIRCWKVADIDMTIEQSSAKGIACYEGAND